MDNQKEVFELYESFFEFFEYFKKIFKEIPDIEYPRSLQLKALWLKIPQNIKIISNIFNNNLSDYEKDIIRKDKKGASLNPLLICVKEILKVIHEHPVDGINEPDKSGLLFKMVLLERELEKL